MDQLAEAWRESSPVPYACTRGTLPWHGAGGSAGGTGTPIPPLTRLLVPKLSPTKQSQAPAPSQIWAPHSVGCSSGLASITALPQTTRRGQTHQVKGGKR